jgi:drug/metabolite transporter (DMT)-like permease
VVPRPYGRCPTLALPSHHRTLNPSPDLAARQARWVLLAALLFASMGVAIKYAVQYVGIFEVVMYRGLVGTVLLGLAMRRASVSLATRYPGMHAWRAMIGTASLSCWFYAIGYIPLPTAMTLNYMSSIWVAAFVLGGALLARRSAQAWHEHAPMMGAVLLGFVGVALLLRPTLASDQALPSAVGLLSGLGAALAYMQVTALTRLGEPASRVVFYFSLGSAVVGAVAALPQGLSWPGWNGAWWLLCVGALAAGGQLALTRAYASGATMLVANLQYTGIVFASLFGIWLFGDTLPWYSWLGMVLIVACGMVASWLRARHNAAQHRSTTSS